MVLCLVVSATECLPYIEMNPGGIGEFLLQILLIQGHHVPSP